VNGEYAPSAHILEGLTLAHVDARPAGAPHSIYEELWHAAEWQRLVLERDDAALAGWRTGEQFPPSPAPMDEASWQALVGSFRSSLQRAVELSRDEAWLDSNEDERQPGVTWRNALECLAVHNAYHLGRIVLLRQLLGIWTPADADA
jgi:hypothetical protein